jgi:CRP/FNR family transcriptional regulator, anaerobic regulatory protein
VPVQAPPLALLKCGDCPIRFRAVCSACDETDLSRLENIKYYRSFQAGQTVAWAGDRMEFVGSVVTGVALLSQTMQDGRRQMVGLLLPSDFFGRPHRTVAAFDVIAKTDIVMCCFRRQPFAELMASTPHLAQRLLEKTLDDLDVARDWMLLLGRKTARERIATFLAMLAQRRDSLKAFPASGSLTLDLPLTREEMADCLGLTLETVSRQISALKHEGIIRLVGHHGVVVPNPARLAALTGDNNQAAPPDLLA